MILWNLEMILIDWAINSSQLSEKLTLNMENLRVTDYFTIQPQKDCPGGANDKEPACKYRRHKRLGFDPWIRKIP